MAKQQDYRPGDPCYRPCLGVPVQYSSTGTVFYGSCHLGGAAIDLLPMLLRCGCSFFMLVS